MNVGVVRRRALLLLPLALAVGCASATADTATPATTLSPTPATVSAAPAATPDDAATLTAQQLTTDLTDLVRTVIHRLPPTRRLLAPLLAVHVAQGAVFAGLAPVPATRASVPKDRRRAVALVVQRETTGAATLAGLATRVQDGSLAAHVAAMAAGIQQALAGLETPTSVTSAATAPAPLRPDPNAVSAWQHVLAAEHWAVYVYGSLGARAPRAAQPVYEAALEAHRGRRDALEAAVRAAGDEPVASAPAYPLTVTASEVEPRMSRTYAALVAAESAPDRAFALGCLADAAVRGLEFGAAPQPLPGLT